PGDLWRLALCGGWLYVAAVIDLFSRKVVGWSVSQSLATDLVQAALRDAIEKRRPDGSQLLHHSDRSCQSPAMPISRHCEHSASPVRCQEPATVTTTAWPNGSSGA
ncbi:MAG: DDE-type integrase/transposase/recombinase, partial [Planctomycetales bacterium]